MTDDTTKNMKDVKDIIPQLLAVAFVALVIFYPSTKSQPASILQAVDQSTSERQQAVETSVSASGPVVKDEVDQEVIYYGQMKRYSPSGMLAFYYYDVKKGQLEQPDNPRHWFWATVYPDDPKFSDLIGAVSGDGAWDRVYKITGLKQEDDIGYYDKDSPVGDIIVRDIQVYNKYKIYG